MVNTSKEKLQSELVKNLYKEERIETLLAEAPDVSQQRDKMIRTVDVLRKAQMILSEIEISPVPGM
jgi:ribosomal protein L17